MSITVKITLLKKTAQVPEYQTEGAAAVDLHACVDETIVVQPMERVAIPTGIAIELPDGYEAQVRARSGLSLKQGLGLVNGVGTVDSDYRGEISVLMINWGIEPVEVTPGMRIAQMIFASYQLAEWQVVDSLTASKRGKGGFGSTGS